MLVSFVVGVSVSVRSQDLGLPFARRFMTLPPFGGTLILPLNVSPTMLTLFICFVAAGSFFVSPPQVLALFPFPHVLSLFVSFMQSIFFICFVAAGVSLSCFVAAGAFFSK